MDRALVDARLQSYTAAEHRIGANLHDLEAHSVYQLLQSGVLTGRTEKAMRSMGSADPSLWDLFSLLGSTLEQARKIRGDRNRTGAREHNELVALLDGPSVLIRRDSVPLAERSLTSAQSLEERLTIAQLIDRMQALYEPVRNAVAQADAVLDGLLPRLSSADTTIRSLRATCGELGIDQVDLDRLDATMAEIRDRALTDPLAIPPDARSTIDTALHDATTRIHQARASHAALSDDFARAAELVDRCRALIAEATTDRAASLRKVVVNAALPRPPHVDAIDGDKGIADALEAITQSRTSWQQSRRRLDDWFVRTQRLESQLLRVAARVRRPLDRRDELRGRLRAFRAKMSGIGASEDDTLRTMSNEIHNELYTAPSDLDRAARLLNAFGEQLAASRS